MQRAPDGTASATFFAESALDLARRLTRHPSPRAKTLLAVASRLASQFQGWARTRPTDAERVTAIRELFELNRQVLELDPGIPGKDRRSGSFPPREPERKR